MNFRKTFLQKRRLNGKCKNVISRKGPNALDFENKKNVG